MKHIMSNKMIPIAVVLATAALLAMTAATPLAFAEDPNGDIDIRKAMAETKKVRQMRN
jgi:hypothetical protein